MAQSVDLRYSLPRRQYNIRTTTPIHQCNTRVRPDPKAFRIASYLDGSTRGRVDPRSCDSLRHFVARNLAHSTFLFTSVIHE